MCTHIRYVQLGLNDMILNKVLCSRLQQVQHLFQINYYNGALKIFEATKAHPPKLLLNFIKIIWRNCYILNVLKEAFEEMVQIPEKK